MPNSFPKSSTHGVGSTPGNNTKNVGVCGDVSSYVAGMLKGACSTYSLPARERRRAPCAVGLWDHEGIEATQFILSRPGNAHCGRRSTARLERDPV